jgi:hypothetical protein
VSALDLLGAPVPVPDGVEAGAWGRLCARVVMLPGGCHLWTAHPRDDGYAQFWSPAGALAAYEGDPARPWRAHRFAYVALTGTALEPEDHLMHQCDQPLCVPITAEALLAHLVPGDNVANVREREQRGRGARRGRWGLPVASRSDRRGQLARSLAIHTALADALGLDAEGRPTVADVDREALAARVAEVEEAGRYDADWPVLPIFEEPAP